MERGEKRERERERENKMGELADWNRARTRLIEPIDDQSCARNHRLILRHD